MGSKSALGTASMVLGIVGVVLAFIPIIGVLAWPTVIVGLVLGIVALQRVRAGAANNRGQAVAGIALSGVGLAICVIWLAIFGVVASNPPPPPPATVPSSPMAPAAPQNDNEPAPAAPPLSNYLEQSFYDQARAYGVEGTDEQLKSLACDLREADFDLDRISQIGQEYGITSGEASYISGLSVGFPCGN